MNPSDRVLRQYLAEALEPPRAEEVREALARSPALAARLALLIAETPPEPAPPERPGWRMPPPGVTAPFLLQGTFASGAVMDADQADWIELSIEVPEADLDCVVVVLERRDAAWEVLFPTDEDEVIRASELPHEGSLRRLDVTLQPEVERLSVVLVPEVPDLGAADPWASVREAVASGQRPVITFDVRER